MLAQEAILNYLDFSKPFVIHSDASEFFGTSQDGKPLAYYTRKLNLVQKNYIVEKNNIGYSRRAESI